jgi:hypothetical protein
LLGLLQRLNTTKSDDLLVQIANQQELDEETEAQLFDTIKQRSDNVLLACRIALRSPHATTQKLAVDHLIAKPSLIKAADFYDILMLCIANKQDTTLLLSSVSVQERLLAGKRLPDHKFELQMICRCCITESDIALLFATQYVSGMFGVASSLGHFVNNRFVLRTYLDQSWNAWRRNDTNLSKMCEAAILCLEARKS